MIIFDVDMVLGDGNIAPKCRHSPIAHAVVTALHAVGFELRAWSAGGEKHARQVVKHGGWAKIFTAYYDKPEYPMEERQALALLGDRPVLQFDDDPGERVGNWPFILVDWYGG